MDILKYMGSLEIEAKDEEQLSRFLKEKESEIKGSILALWKEFSAENITESEIKDEVLVHEESSIKVETTDKVKEDLKIEDENKSVDISVNNESILTQCENTPIDGNKTKSEPVKIEQIKDKNANSFELQIKNKNIIIPNGKVNQDYCFLFKIEELGLTEIGDYWFEGLEAIGLAFYSDTNEIKGKPIVAGDHKIKLKIKRNDWSDGKPLFERQITFIINPDPKSLWKNIPTPSDIEYYKPDSAKCFVKVESTVNHFCTKKTAKKDMVAASQRGRSHAQEGKPRDDDFNIRYLSEVDWYILTVADGAGSAKYSRKGSEIACKTIVEVCEQLIKEKKIEFENIINDYNTEKSDERRKKIGDFLYSILGNSVFKAVKNIEEEAKKTNRPLKDYSTTLIVSICKKFEFGWFVGAFWVGDGGIGIYNKDTNFLKILCEPDSGVYAGQTRFLTMPEITQPIELYRRLRFDIVDDFTALILMTDGITDPKFETDANLLKVEKWNE
ncbi:MAG: protein phosphatase 2C domain-containing protein, partial [Ignavibacteria bacterium]|nr:protein phosphatase 2C domain-containing protein [Ignavibacteria bacterium]